MLCAWPLKCFLVVDAEYASKAEEVFADLWVSTSSAVIGCWEGLLKVTQAGEALLKIW